MDALLLAAIIVIDLIILDHAYRSKLVPDFVAALWLKIGGAASGSAVAVGFRPGKDGIFRLIFRWLAGAWVGFIGSDFAIDWMEWPQIDHYILFVASALGVTGYLLLQLLLGPELWAYLRAKLGKKAEAVANEP